MSSFPDGVCGCWCHLSGGELELVFAFRENYERELIYLERVLSPGKVFVDVGACFGIYAVVAGKIVGNSGRVLAFEPALRRATWFHSWAADAVNLVPRLKL